MYLARVWIEKFQELVKLESTLLTTRQKLERVVGSSQEHFITRKEQGRSGFNSERFKGDILN